jgi:hypothetical protein
VDRPLIRDLVPIERVWTRLEGVERRLYEVTRSDDRFLTEIAQHLLGAGGKRYTGPCWRRSQPNWEAGRAATRSKRESRSN